MCTLGTLGTVRPRLRSEDAVLIRVEVVDTGNRECNAAMLYTYTYLFIHRKVCSPQANAPHTRVTRTTWLLFIWLRRYRFVVLHAEYAMAS